VFQYANLYDAYVVIDVIGTGVSNVLKLVELGYKKLHYDTPSNLLMGDGRLKNMSKNNKVPGFNVSKVRLPMIAHLEYSLRENTVVIRSARVTSELKTFVYKAGRPDHKKGYNDDTIMTLAMGLWVMEHSFKQLESSVSKSKAILSSWTTNSGQAQTSHQRMTKEGKRNTYSAEAFNQGTTGYVNKNNTNDYGDNLWLFSDLK